MADQIDPASLTLIETNSALADFIANAAHEPVVAIDTEAASFHRYVDRIYLVQLSTTRATAVVDPLRVDDLTPLGVLLADPATEVVFHDADYDLRALDRDYGFRVRRLFDTRIAAQLLGEPSVGLAALLERHFGITLSKKWQRADWSQRPLPPEMLAYAAADTRYLLPLRTQLTHGLAEAGRLSWAREEFARAEAVRWTPPPPHDAAYLRLKGATRLAPQQRSVLRLLHRWREDEARRRDRPLFRILPNEALVAIARNVPRNPEDLFQVRGLPRALAERHRTALLDAVAAGLAAPQSDRRPDALSPRPAPREPAQAARLERLKQARNRLAAELGLDPGVLCGKPVLEAVARAAPRSRQELRRIPEVRDWQVEVLGAALLAALPD